MNLKKIIVWLSIAIAIVFSSSIFADDGKNKIVKNGISVELHVLPAEPFYTQEEINSQEETKGMIAVGGEKPIQMNDNIVMPNHHLVAHIYNEKTGKAVSNANVSLFFQAIDKDGKVVGKKVNVPVTIMQAIGKGEQSTHYGNNTNMKDGTYRITFTINGTNYIFTKEVNSLSKGKRKTDM